MVERGCGGLGVQYWRTRQADRDGSHCLHFVRLIDCDLRTSLILTGRIQAQVEG